MHSFSKKIKSRWRTLHAIPHKAEAEDARGAGKVICKHDKRCREGPFFPRVPVLHPSALAGLGSRSSLFFSHFLFPVSFKTNQPKLNTEVKIHFTGTRSADIAVFLKMESLCAVTI